MIGGYSGSYVHDLLRSGDSYLQKSSRTTREKFDMDEDESLRSELKGFHIDRDKDGTINLSQNRYLRNLEELPMEASLENLRSMRMRLAWISNSRP